MANALQSATHLPSSHDDVLTVRKFPDTHRAAIFLAIVWFGGAIAAVVATFLGVNGAISMGVFGLWFLGGLEFFIVVLSWHKAVIDLYNRTVTRHSLPFGPYDSWSLDEYDHVVIAPMEGCDLRGNKSKWGYDVRLEGAGLPLKLQQHQSGEYEKARKCAERVARILKFDIWDSAHGDTVVYERSKPAVDAETAAEDNRQTTKRFSDTTLPQNALVVRRWPELSHWIVGALMIVVGVSMGFWCLHLMFPPPPGVVGFRFAVVMCTFQIGLFLYLGFWILAGRVKGAKFDLAARTIKTWTLLRLFGRTRPLADFEVVTLTYEVLGSKNPYDRFNVRLDGRGGVILLYMTANKEKARQIAGNVSEFLRLPLRDCLKLPRDDPALPAWVAENVAGRQLGPIADDASFTVETTPNGQVISLPAPGFRQFRYLVVAVLLAPIAMAAIAAIADWLGLPDARDAVLGFLCLAMFFSFPMIVVFVLLPASAVWQRREEIHVRSGELEIRRVRGWRTTRESLTLDEIRTAELDPPASFAYTSGLRFLFAPREVVRFCGTSYALEFGGWLTHDERLWLRDNVARIVVRR